MRSRRCYSELKTLKTFQERYEYLKIGGTIGIQTFGNNRYINQDFYHSDEWRRFRRKVIIRDNGCDLGIEGMDLLSRIHIHHIIPMTLDDIINRNPLIFDLDNAICASESTHRAIHYAKDDLVFLPIERKPGDTKLW